MLTTNTTRTPSCHCWAAYGWIASSWRQRWHIRWQSKGARRCVTTGRSHVSLRRLCKGNVDRPGLLTKATKSAVYRTNRIIIEDGNSSSRYREGAVAKCDASRWRHDQCRRRSRPKTPTCIYVGGLAEGLGKIRRCSTIKAAVHQNT